VSQRFIAHICYLSVVLFAAVTVQAQQPKADSDAAISQTLQAIERAWLNAEKNHDVAALEKMVADDWITKGGIPRAYPPGIYAFCGY
jgi:uncharacterized membrane protein